MYEFEEALQKVDHDERLRLNRKMADPKLNLIVARDNDLLKQYYRENTTKLSGMSQLGVSRHVARIPVEVYNAGIRLHGEDFWDNDENLKHFPEFLVVDKL